MNNDTNGSLLTSLKVVLKTRGFDTYEDIYLQYELDRAIGEINRCRRFTPTDKVKYDEKYEYLIIPMVTAAIAKIGAEGQTSHSENGVVRNYGSAGDYPKELLTQITPLIKTGK
jgi:hypothetical protein